LIPCPHPGLFGIFADERALPTTFVVITEFDYSPIPRTEGVRQGHPRLAGSSRIVMAPASAPTTIRPLQPAKARPRRSSGSQIMMRWAPYEQLSHPEFDSMSSVSDRLVVRAMLEDS
jgi:hypothetical protein